MAKPGTVPPVFASASVFTAASGLPAGAEALEGTSVRLSPPADFWTYGLVPGNPLYAQWMDYLLGWETEWTRWVADGTSTMTKTAHLVETDSSGIARLWALRLGDGTATGLNATKKLDVIGDGTQKAATISTPASGLEALDIACASNFAPAIYVLCTGTQGALECDASGSTNPTAKFTATTQPAVSATSTAGVAVDATATSAAAAVRGTGQVAGVLGVASAAGGTGVVAQSHASATSSGEALVAQAFADGVGLRAVAADGPAVSATNTGEEDTMVVLANGDGASLRLDPRGAAPLTDRVGQLWPEEVDTDRATLAYCGNATGLAQAQRYIWGGTRPMIADMAENDATQTYVQNTTNNVLVTLVVDNPYPYTVPVRVHGRMTTIRDVGMAGGQVALCTPTLHDATANTTIETDSFSLESDTHRLGFTIETLYSLPAATTTTLTLRATVGIATTGGLSFSHCKLSVITAEGGFV